MNSKRGISVHPVAYSVYMCVAGDMRGQGEGSGGSGGFGGNRVPTAVAQHITA
jgi:hypothetical protein